MARSALIMGVLSVSRLPAGAQTPNNLAYTFTTLAGQPFSGSADGVGSQAQFNGPQGIAVDNTGNVYVLDSGNDTIRKITASGVVSTIAGIAGVQGSADGTNAFARFNFAEKFAYFSPFGDTPVSVPIFCGLALDNGGSLYVVDSGNFRIRRITMTGTNWVVSTIAGWVQGYADGQGTNAQFWFPSGIAVDADTNIYVSDTGLFDDPGNSPGYSVRVIRPSGSNWNVSTVGFTQSAGLELTFGAPMTGVAVDSLGNVYASISYNLIAEIPSMGAQSEVGGSIDAYGLAVYKTGVLYAASENGIYRFAQNGSGAWAQSLFAGGTKGSANGAGADAQFSAPQGVAVDASGKVYVSDTGNNLIRTILPSGDVGLLAGSGNASAGSSDGSGTDARFNRPTSVAVDTTGNLYVADAGNNTIRTITSAGLVNTLAGLARTEGTNDGVGSDARFNDPEGLAVDLNGNVYVADTGNAAVRLITPEGVVSTIATGLSHPRSVALDSYGNVYVAEQAYSFAWVVPSNTICELTANSWQTSSIVLLNQVLLTNNPYSECWEPVGITVDGSNNLYFTAAHESDCVLTPSSTLTMLVEATTSGTLLRTASVSVGPAINSGSADYGVLYPPASVAVDTNGNLYVADRVSSTIEKFSAADLSEFTIGGTNGLVGSFDGAGAAALFSSPSGIAVDDAGNVYVADTGNNTIRKGFFSLYAPANPVSIPVASNYAALTVALCPTNAGGQWRFPWELTWHDGGATVSNLAPGNYTNIEFSTVPGYLPIPSYTNVYLGPDVSTNLMSQYYATVSTPDTNGGAGLLTVVFQAGLPGNGGGWRILGDINTNWLPSGYTTNLLPATYLIEFESITGFANLPPISVPITPGSSFVVQEIYQPPQQLPASSDFLLPQPVPGAEIGDMLRFPFGYTGQIVTDVGYGSGVAVSPNVVLTAAHLVFNDQTLSYVSNVWWFPDEDPPFYMPEPLQAEGWFVLSNSALNNYASLRIYDRQTNGFKPGESSAESRNFDVAAVCFSGLVANGGYSGYLPSDTVPNSWLSGNSEKMLVGYPVDNSAIAGATSVTNGTMYEIGPQPYPLTNAPDSVNEQQEVYTASWFLAYPGNSGGPLFVQYDGYYYPAAVYLGTLSSGTTPFASWVRAIDSDVVKMITNAQFFALTGTNNSGGGVVLISAPGGIAANPGTVEVTIGPPAAVQAGGAWKFSNLSNVWYSTRNPSVLSVTSTNEPELDFKPLTNWNLPTNESVEVLPGHIVSLTNYYTLAVVWSNPPPITYGTPLTTNQLNAIVPAITNNPPGTYTYSPTFGQVLDVGPNILTVTFTPPDTNLYGNVGATNSVELIVMPVVVPQIQSVSLSGTSFTFTCSTVSNETYQIQYTTNLAENIWTNLGPPIIATSSTAMVSDSVSNVQQFYRALAVP